MGIITGIKHNNIVSWLPFHFNTKVQTEYMVYSCILFCCWGLYILARTSVITGRVPNCDFLVLPHWNISLPTPYQSWHFANQPSYFWSMWFLVSKWIVCKGKFDLLTSLENIDFHIICYWMSSIWSLWHISLDKTRCRYIAYSFQ